METEIRNSAREEIHSREEEEEEKELKNKFTIEKKKKNNFRNYECDGNFNPENGCVPKFFWT